MKINAHPPRGGSPPPRSVAPRPARVPLPLFPRRVAAPRAPRRSPRPCPVAAAPRCRAPRPCPVAVGRDVPIAPPRHRRGAWLCPVPLDAPLATPGCRYAHSLPARRDGDIAPYRHYARPLCDAISHQHRCTMPCPFAPRPSPCAPPAPRCRAPPPVRTARVPLPRAVARPHGPVPLP